MKAVRVNKFGPESVLEIEHIPIPVPKSNQVLVQIKAAGINPVDTYLRSGQYPMLPSLPYTPGKDGAGIVVEVGNDVVGIEKGNRVWLTGSETGTYAQYAVCKPNQIHPLSDSLSFDEGAGIGVPYCTAYRALIQRATPSRPSSQSPTVLIHGASGSVGVATIQIALAHSFKIIGTAGSQDGLDLIRSLGCELVFNHYDPKHYEQVMTATNGRGVDIIVEMLANVNLGEDLKVLAPGGRVMVVGSRGDVTITPRFLMSFEADIRGVSLMKASDEDMKQCCDYLNTFFDQSEQRKVVISKRYQLNQVQDAHRDILSISAKGRTILLPFEE